VNPSSPGKQDKRRRFPTLGDQAAAGGRLALDKQIAFAKLLAQEIVTRLRNLGSYCKNRPEPNL
jgi:hypothetical protein